MRPSNFAGMSIPLIDLSAQYQRIKPEIDAAIQRVLDRAQFILGPEGEALERELAAYCGTAYAVAVASGTDALELSLRACGIGPGDEVLTTPFTFFATVESIVSVGATPVFVDIDPVTYNLDTAQLRAKLTPNTKAILPVHLYGHPCDMDALMRVADEHQLMVIEDCAQAIGATWRGRRVGSFGIAGCLSFYPTKNLGAYGDGGLVVTCDVKLAEQLRILRVHGSPDRVHYQRLGRNSRLDELQAAILRVKLPHLEAWNRARREHAATYRRLFERHQIPGLVLPEERPGAGHVYHLYVIRCPQREVLQQALVAQGIAAQIHYALALTQQPILAPYVARSGSSCPTAEALATQILSLPVYPELTPALIEKVVLAVAKALH